MWESAHFADFARCYAAFFAIVLPQLDNMKTTAIACVAFVLLGPGLSARCHAQPEAEYAIKEAMPRTGSHIRLNIIESKGGIALNQKYAELSAQDRGKLHTLWESIPDGDEPPFPAKGLKPIHDAVYKAQQQLLVEGPLTLIATVNPQGKVDSVKVINSPSPEMTKFAASLVALTEFKPAICGGTPCQMDFPVYYKFLIKK